MWSIGDRYHDWWGNRGDIDSYKKCGDWKILPDMLHYAVICESVIAFHKFKNTFGKLPEEYNSLIHTTIYKDNNVFTQYDPL
jgi:hypothetical protein